MGICTNGIIYSRGVPKNDRFFARAVQSNFPVIQPEYLYINNKYPRKYNPKFLINNTFTNLQNARN